MCQTQKLRRPGGGVNGAAGSVGVSGADTPQTPTPAFIAVPAASVQGVLPQSPWKLRQTRGFGWANHAPWVRTRPFRYVGCHRRARWATGTEATVETCMDASMKTSTPDLSPLADPVRVSLSRWINEPPVPCGELLTARDVARMTRRGTWVLAALVLTGRLPKRYRFQGRPVGWLRSDIEGWLRLNSQASSVPGSRAARRCSNAVPRLFGAHEQTHLPFRSLCRDRTLRTRLPCASRSDTSGAP